MTTSPERPSTLDDPSDPTDGTASGSDTPPDAGEGGDQTEATAANQTTATAPDDRAPNPTRSEPGQTPTGSSDASSPKNSLPKDANDTDTVGSVSDAGAFATGDTPTREAASVTGGGSEAAPAAEERWQAFAAGDSVASDPAPPQGWWSRAVRAVFRFWTHEWTVVSVISLALATLMTWPTLRDPTRTIPQDIYDPLLQAWQIAWAGHALLTDPTNLWNSNTFYPLEDSYAFSDTLLGYAPLGMIGSGPTATIVRYNIIYVLLHALAFVGAYALARQLGARWPGAAVAGAAFAYAPWRLAQAGHMHVLSTGGIALALAMLARGHGWSLTRGFRPETGRIGWVIAGWAVAAWQLTLGFGIGLPFAYALALICVIATVSWLVGRLRRRVAPFRLSLLFANVCGALLFVAVGIFMALPYFRVAEAHPGARRTEADLELFSPPLRGFLTAPAESWLWGSTHESAREALPFPAEMTLLPGTILLALALAGLFVSIWSWWQRLWLAVATVITVLLAMGTQFFDGRFSYLLLFRYLPGWEGIRTPGRLIVWTTLLLAVLAAGCVSAFVRRSYETAEAAWIDHREPPRPAPLLRLAMVIPVLLVLVEGWNLTPHPRVPSQPVALQDLSGPALVLPSTHFDDQAVMLWSTDGFPQVVNGGSGFTPQLLTEIRERSVYFPDQSTVEYLRELGVETVVVLGDRAIGTPWEWALTAPINGLDIERREVGNAVIFDL